MNNLKEITPNEVNEYMLSLTNEQREVVLELVEFGGFLEKHKDVTVGFSYSGEGLEQSFSLCVIDKMISDQPWVAFTYSHEKEPTINILQDIPKDKMNAYMEYYVANGEKPKNDCLS